jgi:hypothetical protein
MNINAFFQKVFIVNLPRRTDRRALAEAELAISGIDPALVEWVDGVDIPERAHAGCTSSHRNILRRVADGPWERVLILEDDFKVLTYADLVENGFAAYSPSPVLDSFKSVLDGRGNLAERFDYLSEFVPADADVLYIAAGYAEPPIARVNKHVLRCGAMFTTSTYGITRDFAKTWTRKTDEWAARHTEPFGHPIDSIFGAYSHDHNYYVFQPRLAFQRGVRSDITGQNTSYLMSMTDSAHENLL